MTQNPVLTNPNKGRRNQNSGSCEPSKRSFFVKSIADSVAFPPHLNKFAELAPREELVIASDVARKVRASRRSGNDDLKQRSMDSEKAINIPGSH